MSPHGPQPGCGFDREDPLAGAVEVLAEHVRAAQRVLVLTGAGVSVASGLPTYRGDEQSRYADKRALQDAFGSTIRKDPAGFWDRFRQRRAELQAASPNAAHHALSELARCSPSFCLATQNVDGLHGRAGSVGVVELHGNAFRERCLDDACSTDPWPAADLTAGLPHCPTCGGVARPDLVLFGEGDDARWTPLRSFVAEGVDVLLLVGTSGVVSVPTQLCQLVREAGPAWIAEINPRPTDQDELRSLLDDQFAFPAEVLLPALVGALGAGEG